MIDETGSVYTVTSSADSGPGTLREAIHSGLRDIRFDLPDDETTIRLSGALPPISFVTTIDGGPDRVIIDGSGIEVGGAVSGLLTQSEVELKNLRIQDFPGSGVMVASGKVSVENSVLSGNDLFGIRILGGYDHRIVGNLIGTDENGQIGDGNGRSGLRIENALGAEVVGNVVSGNGLYGIFVFGPGSFDIDILGNKVGTDLNGEYAIPNLRAGVLVHNASDVRIGGSDPADRNIISGNGRHGINLDGASPTPDTAEPHYGYKGFNHSNSVIGNYIGLGADGVTVIPNGFFGIWSLGARDNVIGGASPADGNYIAGNGKHGIAITGSVDEYPDIVQGFNLIGNNKIGLNALGEFVPNGVDDILIRRSVSNVVQDNLIGSLDGGFGTDDDDRLNGTPGDDTIMGLAGNDHLNGSAGNDVLFGGAGTDWMIGGAGADTLAGGAGNDTYIVDDTGDMVIELASEGIDSVRAYVRTLWLGDNVENLIGMLESGQRLAGNAEDNSITGGDGNDVMTGGAGGDLIRGRGSDDRIWGQDGNDLLRGDSGNDTIHGGTGDDNIDGGDGDDILQGARGRDVMTGGEGDDTFVFVSTTESARTAEDGDIITDFQTGADRIDLSAIDASTVLAGHNDFTFGGATPAAMSAGGYIYYEQVEHAGGATGMTLVHVHTDDDISPEMVIRLNGLHSLTVEDFIL